MAGYSCIGILTEIELVTWIFREGKFKLMTWLSDKRIAFRSSSTKLRAPPLSEFPPQGKTQGHGRIVEFFDCEVQALVEGASPLATRLL